MGTRVSGWQIPSSEMRSDRFRLHAGDTDIPVWLGRVREAIHKPEHSPSLGSAFNGPCEWCSFARLDAEFPVELTIQITRPVNQAEILPRSAGVTAKLDGSTVRFSLQKPGHLTLLLDGCDEHPLHIFCRETEREPCRNDDPNVIYFGPGEHWVTSIRPRSGQTVYLHGDSIVRAMLPEGAQGKRGGVLNLVSYPGPVIDIQKVENVRVCGRGILDGTLLPHPAKNLICVRDSSNIRIEGITLRNSPNWHLPIVNSQDIVVEGLVGLSGRLNSDGINCVSSSRVVVRDCFIRGHDDSFAVKATNPERPSTDILYERCVAWNDWGFAFGITYETRADIRNVTYRDCDVVYARNYPLGVFPNDRGTISDIQFERIGIEYPKTQLAPYMARVLVTMGISATVWGKDSERGHVRNVTLRDIDVRGENIPPMTLNGYDAAHLIEDVRFENFRINGRLLASPEDHIFQCNEFVRGLRVETKM